MGCCASHSAATAVQAADPLVNWAEKSRMGAPPDLSTDPVTLDWNNIIVHLQRAEDLPSSDWLTSADAYVRCSVELKAGVPPSGRMDGGVEGVNKCEFACKDNTASPEWDRKRMLCYSVAAGSSPEAVGLRVQLLDSNALFQDVQLAVETLPIPAAGTGWQQHTLKTSGDGKLLLALKSVRAPFFTQMDYESLRLHERIISAGSADSECKASLAYRCTEGNTKMVLMLPGRCDSFTHPHVARAFMERGFDFFHLDYRRVGRARKFMQDELFVSHSGNFDEYFEDITGTLRFIESLGKAYKSKVWLSHADGATILLNFIMRSEIKDRAFTHLVMNSPFLDWGAASPLSELVLENITTLASAAGQGRMAVPGKEGGHRMNPWHFKVWTLHRPRPCDRPIYITPHLTQGYCQAATRVHCALQAAKGTVTNKPVFCITSESDDVLDCGETVKRATWFGSNVTIAKLRHNAHDVFLSPELEASNDAIARTMAWIERQTRG